MPTLSEELINQLSKDPEKIILHLIKSGDEDSHHSYQQLMDGASQYAAVLSDLGIKPGEVVIIILQHGLDLIFAYFGTILIGAIPSIMPFLTEKLLPDKYRKDLISLIGITKPSGIVTFEEFKQEINKIDIEFPLKGIIYSEKVQNEFSFKFSKIFPGVSVNQSDIVLLQHSSGTTGLQKGVALSHKAIFNQLKSYSEAIHLNKNDVIVSWLPLYHDMGLIASFLMPILLGIPLVLMSPFDWVRAPHKLFKAISDYGGTLTWLPNFAYNFCAKKIREDDLKGLDLSSMRAVINCSEPMRFESHEMFAKRFFQFGLKKSTLATCYAMAENVFAVTQDGIDKPVTYDEIDLEAFQIERIAKKADKAVLSLKMVSAGKPVANCSVRIIDEKGNDLPERHLGEIILKSDCMLEEYYLRKDETQKSMMNGWFKTGDLGYLAENQLYISGRKKDLIIVGGKNIYPQDIESVVTEVHGIHPGRAVAFGVYNEEKGTEDVFVIAELDSDLNENKAEIADEIRRNVTRSTAVALRQVLLVDDKWLIKTSSGKIARSANKTKYMENN